MWNKQLLETQHLNFNIVRNDLLTTKNCKHCVGSHKTCVYKIYISNLILSSVIVACWSSCRIETRS